MADKIKDNSERVAAYSGETVVERFVKEITVNVADDLAYRGLTLRQWADKIVSGEYAPVVHGRWVYHNFDTICSECRKSAIFDEWEQQAETEFCPHCGAKMGGEEHNG